MFINWQLFLVGLATGITYGLTDQFVYAQPLSELKFDLANLDTEHVDCKSKIDIIDECGLQQGFSYRFSEFGYPTNQTSLMSSCKRQADAFKCLRAYSKCLSPLSKQVLIALVNSRQKYNKRVCSEKNTEASAKVVEFSQCMMNSKVSLNKAVEAELNSITASESIANSKIDSVQERIKHSCCSVARVRKEYLDATVPDCKQYTQVASEMIDSYLSDTIGIICPDFENKGARDCDKLPKLAVAKSSNARYFVRPTLNLVQTLQA